MILPAEAVRGSRAPPEPTGGYWSTRLRGHPIWWALTVGGAGGAAGLMDYFHRELVNTVLHLGMDRIASLGREHVPCSPARPDPVERLRLGVVTLDEGNDLQSAPRPSEGCAA